jgi:hypothetical protein
MKTTAFSLRLKPAVFHQMVEGKLKKYDFFSKRNGVQYYLLDLQNY